VSEKLTKNKRTQGIAQVVENLPSKRKALNSTPNTTKKERELEVSKGKMGRGAEEG
jgi:hypothetical protein